MRTYQQWTLVTALSVGALAASACGSSKKKNDDTNKVYSGTDSGTTGATDAGGGASDAGDMGPKMCGTNTCMPATVLNTPIAACCAGSAKDQCGIAPPGPTMGACLAKNQPGTASAFCTGALTALQAASTDGGVADAGATGDGGASDGGTSAAPMGWVVHFTSAISVTYPGCCVPKAGGKGECGLYSDQATLAGQPFGAALGLGCLPLDALASGFPGGKIPAEARVACTP